jgi:hypothetical protein
VSAALTAHEGSLSLDLVWVFGREFGREPGYAPSCFADSDLRERPDIVNVAGEWLERDDHRSSGSCSRVVRGSG